jgi:transcriptional regulator with XRE-family HTH domain
MIRNERQYKVTQKQRKTLADELRSLMGTEERPIGEDVTPPLVFELQRASLEGQIADLDAQLLEYEQLQAGQVTRTVAASLGEIPIALIKARISAGLTQRELAVRLGMKEQQIQRYESEGYASASLARLEEVRRALGVELEAGIDLPVSDSPLASLRKRLANIGFDRVVVERLLRDVAGRASPSNAIAIAERIARVLAVPTEALLSEGVAMPEFATTARFKAPRNAAEAKLRAYARYAEGIARIAVRATARLDKQMPVPDARAFRGAVDQLVREERSSAGSARQGGPTSGELFTAALRFLWSLGVVVIPLRDVGAFHGACFTIEGRSVLIVKQTGDSMARWLNDLLHEAAHLQDPARGKARTWIEMGDIGVWNDDPEEQRANSFAADVLFEGRAGHVIAQCKSVAQGSVERLKAVLPRVARQAEVAPDILAGYLAFQLSAEGVNWWGTAASFQEHEMPWRTAVDELLTRLDFAALDQVDRAALLDALSF